MLMSMYLTMARSRRVVMAARLPGVGSGPGWWPYTPSTPDIGGARGSCHSGVSVSVPQYQYHSTLGKSLQGTSPPKNHKIVI